LLISELLIVTALFVCATLIAAGSRRPLRSFLKIKPVHQNRCLLLFRNRYYQLRYRYDPGLKSIATEEKS
jgi:hypothetical protein